MSKKYPFSRNKKLVEELIKEYTTSQIAKMYGCCRELVSYHTKKFGLVNPHQNYNTPNLEPSKCLSYVVGVLVGDGCASKYDKKGAQRHDIKLKVIDKEFAEEFSRCLASIMGKANPYAVWSNKKDNFWHTAVCSKELYYYYVNKGYSLCIEQYPAGFIKGFFDSEGSISCGKHGSWNKVWYIQCSNNNINLLDTVKQLLSVLGIDSAMSLRGRKGFKITRKEKTYYKNKDVYSLSIPSKHHHKFARLIGFTIKRKQDRLNELIATRQEKPELFRCPVCQIEFKPWDNKQRFCCLSHKKAFGHVKEQNKLSDADVSHLYQVIAYESPHLINVSGHINKKIVDGLLKNKEIKE